jgi:glycosyltransferase involved in cell wall biosynthesis
MDRPTLSLIVCVYNQRPWLPAILAAVSNQAVSVPFEFLVCDDGSADDVFEALRSSPHLARLNIRYVWQPHVGHRVSRSRNNAIRLAQGRLLVFLDGDTWVPPDFLQSHYEAHSSEGRLVCGLRCTVFAPPDDRLPTPTVELLTHLSARSQPEHEIQREWIDSDRPWMACLSGNFSIPASARLLFDERFESWGSEDRDFAYRAFKDGLIPCLLAKPNAIHLALTDGHWSRMPHQSVIDFLNNKRYLAAKYPDGVMEPSLRLIRHCRLNRDTEKWSMGPLRSDVSVADVFREFDAWRLRQPALTQSA